MGILDKLKKKKEDEDLPDLPDLPESSSPPGISTDKPSSLTEPTPTTPALGGEPTPTTPAPEEKLPEIPQQPQRTEGDAPMGQAPVEQMSEVTPVKGENEIKTEIEILSAKVDAIKSRIEAINNKLDAVYRVVLGGAKYQ